MNIIICGCNGKMGQAVANSAGKISGCNIVAGVDIINKENNFPVFNSVSQVNTKADVVIDFSHPCLLSSILNYCKLNNTPAVICTTGLSKEQIEEIKNTSKKVPIFYSRNMSLGVNLISELCKKAAQILHSEFDIEIIEKHHNQKIDAPSGTALMLAEDICEAIDQTLDFTYDRTQTRKARAKNEIGIHSIRGGSIAGEHEVIFAGQDEVVSIVHRAESRNIFANGAIKAAKFMLNKHPRLYTMKDMVNI